MKTAVVYARVSSAEQARPDATSVEQQVERGMAYAASQGWEVRGTVIDDGVSGATSLSERTYGRRLFDLPGIDAVIFWSMDRFTRSASRGLRDIEALEEKGLGLVFVKEAIDTSTPSGRLFRTMLAAFAEFEREQIRDRNMSGRFGAAESGKWASGQLPYGYRFGEAEERDIELATDEATAIIIIFDRRNAGESLKDIARFLNDQTTLTPRPRRDRKTGALTRPRFSPGSIATYLKNPAYKGTPIVRRLAPAKGVEPREFVYEVPAIVSPEVWDAAQKVRLGT